MNRNTRHQQAFALRKQGKSYREIQRKLGIPKATLSYWLRQVRLTREQRILLAERYRIGQIKGARRRKAMRISLENEIIEKEAKKIKKLRPSRNFLWCFGAALYWAEGSKQGPRNISQGTVFSNSDPTMVRLFLLWLYRCCGIDPKNLVFELYVHETSSAEKIKFFWIRNLRLQKKQIKVYFKKHHRISESQSNKKYYGLIRVRVRKSTNLNRAITGWIKGLCEYWGVV